ncbi:WSC domain-containing protein [Panaeolus papilionaceus]|nr:WSC domain-containing protein [Panaeolus papilionaceus]
MISLISLLTVASGAVLVLSTPSLEARQSPTIKNPVGAWQFKGCVQDNVSSRVLSLRYAVPGGNSAEGCTALCHDKGYEFAGLEYGSECWCDHQPAYQTIKPDSECSSPCPADATELCGAGNRLVLYQDTAPKPKPQIKQTVGTWNYKGCYRDWGVRLMTFRFTVPSGNTAESCTALCQSKGYGLAGMEYATECWCDNYLPYGAQMPDSECNSVCPGDNLQYCGASARIQIYVNSAGSPPSPANCINWRGIYSFQNNILYTVPRTSTTPRTKLFNVRTNPLTDPNWYSIIATCPAGCPWTDYYNYGLTSDGVLTSYNSLPLAPVVGSAQTYYFTWPQNTVPYKKFCVKPNPASPDGPFIGFPRLAIDGATDKWSLCPNITDGGVRKDLVYSPIINHPHYVKADCQEVFVEVTPYSV